MHARWRDVARERGRVVIVVGLAPMPAGMGEDDYTRLHEGRCLVALADLA